ncbi:MAG: hypothetical protein FJW32_01195 [Acidobacteria bacterium]|nr:hypothetical protein [Acidobacteriota bacterium]
MERKLWKLVDAETRADIELVVAEARREGAPSQAAVDAAERLRLQLMFGLGGADCNRPVPQAVELRITRSYGAAVPITVIGHDIVNKRDEAREAVCESGALLAEIPASGALYFATIHTADRRRFERIAAAFVWNAAILIGVPLHFSFAPPSQGRSSIILCGALIEALMEAACAAVSDPPLFLSFYLDGSEDRVAGSMRLAGEEVDYEWRVRRESAPVWRPIGSDALAACV